MIDYELGLRWEEEIIYTKDYGYCERLTAMVGRVAILSVYFPIKDYSPVVVRGYPNILCNSKKNGPNYSKQIHEFIKKHRHNIIGDSPENCLDSMETKRYLKEALTEEGIIEMVEEIAAPYLNDLEWHEEQVSSFYGDQTINTVVTSLVADRGEIFILASKDKLVQAIIYRPLFFRSHFGCLEADYRPENDFKFLKGLTNKLSGKPILEAKLFLQVSSELEKLVYSG